MKALKLVKSLSSIGLGITFLFSSAIAQEYDDMYFSKSDRKTVKKELKNSNAEINNSNYKEISETTEAYSSKNVNPEYIAKYKSPEADQANTQSLQNKDAYDSQDYFVEGYDKEEYTSDPNTGEINYAALNKRDQMSAPYQSSYNNSSWGYNPYMSMGMSMGMGYGMGYGSPYYGMGYGSPYYGMGYGYDPFMYGCGSCMSMSMGYGMGYGYSPYSSFSVSMSWGTGGYNPWAPMYGYNPYRYGYNPYYGYGGYNSVIVVSEGNNANRIQYQPRTSRSSTAQSVANTDTKYQRSVNNSTNIRVPQNTVTESAANGRTSKDYSKTQNEYYNAARRSSSSSSRITTVENSRSSYSRNASATAGTYSVINNNKPVRSSNSYSSSYTKPTNERSSYTGFSNNSRSSSSNSFSSPTRSSSPSYSSGSSSGARSTSSSSSGSSSRSSSGSRSSSR